MENSNVNTMELVNEQTGYRDLAAKAKELGIHYVGVPKNELIDKVNEKIKENNSGGAATPTEEPAVEVTSTPTPIENTQNEVPQADSQDTPQTDNQTTETPPPAPTPKPVTETPKPAEKPKERVTRQAAKKWFEEEGAFPYNEGDVVEIVAGKDLIGRKLQVLQPSAKKDMVKGKLIHPVSGALQSTIIALSFDRIQLIQSAAQLNADEPSAAEVNSEENVAPDTPELAETNETPTMEEEVTPVEEEVTPTEEATEEDTSGWDDILNDSEEKIDLEEQEETDEEKAE